MCSGSGWDGVTVFTVARLVLWFRYVTQCWEHTSLRASAKRCSHSSQAFPVSSSAHSEEAGADEKLGGDRARCFTGSFQAVQLLQLVT